MIFGLLHSKFIKDSAEVDLSYSSINPKYILPDIVEQKTPLTGDKYFVLKGSYSEIAIIINLWKYADPVAKYNEIVAYYNNNVELYPHKDEGPLKDIAGNTVVFNLYNIEPFYLTTTLYYDILKLTFKAIGYISLFDNSENILGYGYQYATNYGWGL